MTFCQLAKRLGHGPVLFANLDVVLRSIYLNWKWSDFLVEQRTRSSAAPEWIDREIPSDAEQPAAKSGATLKWVDPVNGPGQALLEDVLRVLTVGHKMTTKAVQVIRMAPKQDFQRFIISHFESPDQVVIRQIL
jgi:hypothetical protein